MPFENPRSRVESRIDHQRALVNIFHTYYYLINLMNDVLKSYDITRQQYNVLRILRDVHPRAASVNLIKAKMFDKMSDVSRIVERLRVKGLVIRQSAIKDKRAVDVTITEKGINFLFEVDPDIARLSELLSNLTSEEAAALNYMLDKIRGRGRKHAYPDLTAERGTRHPFVVNT